MRQEIKLMLVKLFIFFIFEYFIRIFDNFSYKKKTYQSKVAVKINRYFFIQILLFNIIIYIVSIIVSKIAEASLNLLHSLIKAILASI